jgi:tetratricopeptide (TPR) repeat protein
MTRPSDGLPTPLEREAGLRDVLRKVLGVERPRPLIGPYELAEKLGAGGMGIVFAAIDPRLGRRVAVKLLHPELDRHQRDTILREARALARLSHPHVVGIFATGVTAEQTWIAMELVPGPTLSQWSAAHPPTSARRQVEALAMLAGVGAGLHAAHAVGLVHRDVKPSNVLVGPDGRARVADFGLARDVAAAPATRSEAGSRSRSSETDRRHRMPGESYVLAGTPRYMAPEQLRGEPATARSDQYAFCLMAWEILAGRYPYGDASATAREHLEAEHASPQVEPRFVPRFVLGVLRRGLHPDPEQRFASMEDLVRALSTPSRRGRFARWACAGVLALSAAGLASRGSAAAVDRPLCEDASAIRRVETVWDGSRRDALRRRAATSGMPYAPTTVETVEKAMDGFAARWVDASQAACRRAWHDETLDPSRLDATMGCLHRQLELADRFVERVVRGDVAALEHAAVGAQGLPDPGECEAIDAAGARERAVGSEAIASALAAARAALLVGDAPGAIEIARGVTETARMTGDLAALGEGLTVLGLAQTSTGATEDALADLAAAFDLASTADEPRRQADRARLAAVAASSLHRYDEARRWLRHAETAADRGDATPLQRAEIEGVRCRVEWEASAYLDALPACERALEATSEDDSPAAASLRRKVRTTVVAVLSSLGRADEAESISRALLDELRPAVGDDHPTVGSSEQNLGALAYRAGRVDAAALHFERAARIFARSWGPDSAWAISSTSSLGSALRLKGDLDGASAALEDALTRAKTRGDPKAAHVAMNLAVVREAQGRIDDAFALVQEARALEDEHLAADDQDRALTLTVAARLHEARGDLDAAMVAQEQALALRLDSGDRRGVAISTFTLGGILERKGERERALERYVEARRIQEHDDIQGIDRAAVAAAIGVLLVDSDRTDEGLPLLREALEFWGKSDRSDAPARIAQIREAEARALGPTPRRTRRRRRSTRRSGRCLPRGTARRTRW